MMMHLDIKKNQILKKKIIKGGLLICDNNEKDKKAQKYLDNMVEQFVKDIYKEANEYKQNKEKE